MSFEWGKQESERSGGEEKEKEEEEEEGEKWENDGAVVPAPAASPLPVSSTEQAEPQSEATHPGLDPAIFGGFTDQQIKDMRRKALRNARERQKRKEAAEAAGREYNPRGAMKQETEMERILIESARLEVRDVPLRRLATSVGRLHPRFACRRGLKGWGNRRRLLSPRRTLTHRRGRKRDS